MTDPFANLTRIGIDEISYKKGHKYLIVIVDHDTGNLVWAKASRDIKTLEVFFDLLGEERCKKIRLVSADGAEWIANVVKAKCKSATLCMDPFHVVTWCKDALDEVRETSGTLPAGWHEGTRKQPERGQVRSLEEP